jgi:hypothetical protein
MDMCRSSIWIILLAPYQIQHSLRTTHHHCQRYRHNGQSCCRVLRGFHFLQEIVHILEEHNWKVCLTLIFININIIPILVLIIISYYYSSRTTAEYRFCVVIWVVYLSIWQSVPLAVSQHYSYLKTLSTYLHK